MCPERPDFLIQFVDNGTGHDDLHLSLGDYRRTADTYYLALDHHVETDESPAKIRRTLIRLLQAWTKALEKAGDSFVYLPYDLSDEYSGCLRCRIREGKVEILPGFSNREGWTFSPSDPDDYFINAPNFKPDMPAPICLASTEFLDQINAAIANASSSSR